MSPVDKSDGVFGGSRMYSIWRIRLWPKRQSPCVLRVATARIL